QRSGAPEDSGRLLAQAAGRPDRRRLGRDHHGVFALHLLGAEPARQPRDDVDHPLRDLRDLPLPLPGAPEEPRWGPGAGAARRRPAAAEHRPLGHYGQLDSVSTVELIWTKSTSLFTLLQKSFVRVILGRIRKRSLVRRPARVNSVPAPSGRVRARGAAE